MGIGLFERSSMYKQHETGAGLVEYSPLVLVSSCLLVSLYQVLIQGEAIYLCFIGGIVIGIPTYIIGFLVYDNRRKKNKNKS